MNEVLNQIVLLHKELTDMHAGLKLEPHYAAPLESFLDFTA